MSRQSPGPGTRRPGQTGPAGQAGAGQAGPARPPAARPDRGHPETGAVRHAGGAGRTTSAAVYRRRRLVVGLAALLIVVLVAVATAFVWPGWASSSPTPTVTVTQPAPTPTIDPVDPGDGSDFADALPRTVRQFALTSLKATDSWADAGALEAYDLTYADGTGAAATTVAVTAGQWATSGEAEEAAKALVTAAGESTRTGPVTVDGKDVGAYTVTGSGDRTTVTWRNSSAVFQAVGPQAVVKTFFDFYSM